MDYCAVPKGRLVKKLTDLPNIGAVLAQRLRAAGIETPLDLMGLGSVGALRCVQRMSEGNRPCLSMLSALEGAIRGVRWHSIPKNERAELWRRYRDCLEASASTATRPRGAQQNRD